MKTKQLVKFVLFKLYMMFTSKIGFTHYYILSRKIPMYWFTDKKGIVGNCCYGNSRAVKKAMGKNFDSNCMIEHGVYFGRYVLEEECLYPEISTIYTYSPYREEVLKEHFGDSFKKEIVKVGPYIKYVDHFYSSSKLKKIKNRLGRVLLVFPSHSSPNNYLKFDYDAWIEVIKKCAIGFDTVIVSLFWIDILRGNHKYYQKEGYLLTCNGNRFDYHFLNRQKDVISLADMTMSNGIGTHIGYCICMEKPHYLYHQDIECRVEHKCMIHENTDKIQSIREREYKEMYEVFGNFALFITEKQLEIVMYYWGL